MGGRTSFPNGGWTFQANGVHWTAGSWSKPPSIEIEYTWMGPLVAKMVQIIQLMPYIAIMTWNDYHSPGLPIYILPSTWQAIQE